jgi:hypothetical protein
MAIPAPFQFPLALGGPPNLWLGLAVCLLFALVVGAGNAWVERTDKRKPRQRKLRLNYPNSSPSRLPPLIEPPGDGRNGFSRLGRRAR